MGTKNKNRLLSLILVLAMVFSMTPPVSVAATGTDSTEAPASTEATDATDPVEASEGAVAQIGDATYETLAGAIAAAETGATIQLLDSIDLGSEYVTIDKELTLDLCGKTITSAALYALYITGSVILTDSSETAGTIQDISASSVAPVYGAGGSSITVEKVNIVSYYDAYAGIYTCGNLTVNSGDIFGWAGIYANGATVTVNGGTIHGYNCGINDCYGSTVTVNGGTVCYDSSTYAAAASGINVIGNNTDLTTLIVNDGANILGYGFGIATNGSTSYGYTSITINGGTVSAVNGGMYLPAANSTTTITGGEISGYCGIGISNGTLNISGGNITGTAEDSGLDDSYTGSGLNMDGSAIVLAASYGNVTVNISGGTIKSDYSYAIRAYYRSDATAELTTQVTIAGGTLTSGAGMTSDIYIPDGTSYENVTIGATITGGTFSGDVSAYVAVGYTQDENGNVVTDYAAQIGETKYASLADAIDAAKSGDTVVLLKDVTLSETVNIYKSITLDLGNYTITSTADGKAIYTTQALTITAGSGGIDALGCAVMNQKGNGTGALTINGGTYTSSTASAIYNIKGTVTIESGTIQSTAGSKDGICCAENGTDGSAVVIVNGGTIVGTRYGVYSTYNVQISGGEITGTKVGLWIEDGTAAIAGGTITGYEGLKSSSTSAVITIADGTFVGETHGVYAYSDNVTVSGGTFTATGTKDQYAVAFYIDGATVTFSGGTFSGMYSTVWIKSSSDGSYKIETGYVVDTGSLTDSNSSDAEPQVRSVVKGVACIGETYYASIGDAVAAAGSDNTVKLLADVTEDVVIPNGKNITLDLNSHSITNASGHTITVDYGAVLTITGTGTVDNTTHGKGAVVNYGTAYLYGGTFTRSAEKGASSSDNGGNSWYTIKNYNQMTIGNGTDTVTVENSGCYSSCVANGYQNASDKTSAQKLTGEVTPTLTINAGASISGGIATIKNDDNAELTINGGTFTNKNGMVIQNHSTATITGGTFEGSTYAVYNCGCDATDDVGTLIISGGTFSGTFALADVSTANTAAVTVSAGSFTGTSAAIGTSSGSTAEISISGGTYSSAVAYKYCADGYIPTAADDGTYSVEEGTAIASITADGATTYYTAFADAVAAAGSGSTVKLLANVTVDEGLTISKSLTLDLNGNDLKINEGVSLTIDTGAEVSIMDSSADATGIVYNYGSITVNGGLDISDLGYTTSTSSGGLYGQTNGKISIGASGTFVVPDVWAAQWSSLGAWTPNWTSATSGSGIFSSAEVGATVVSSDTFWQCTTAFASSEYDSGVTYWTNLTACVATVTDYSGNITYYETLADAAKYASSLATGSSINKTTITLLRDVTLTERVALENAGTSVRVYLTLDLDGHTITADVQNGYGLYIKSTDTSGYGKITVQNGTIQATANAYGAIEIDHGAAILTSLTLTSQTAGHGTILVDSVTGSNAVFTDLTITTTDGYCLEVNNSSNTAALKLSGKQTYTQIASNDADESQLNACVYLHGSTGMSTSAQAGSEINWSSDGYGVYISSNRVYFNKTVSGKIEGKTKGIYVDSSYTNSNDAVTVVAASTIAVDGGVESAASAYDDYAISISGGSYEEDLPDAYVPSGYECVLDSDSTSDTCGRYIIQIVDVAEVYNGDTLVGSYNSLSGAITATKTGYTVKLIKDCSSSSTITINKNLTIDLNGNTYAYTGSSNAFTLNNSYYTVTITDTSDDGDGKIEATVSGAAAVAVLRGTLNVEGKATICAPNGGQGIQLGGYSGAAYSSTLIAVVNVKEDATVSGEEVGVGIYGSTYSSATANSYGPSLNVVGGTVKGGYYGIAGNGSTTYKGNTFINVSSGTVEGDVAIYNPQAGTVTISDDAVINGTTSGVQMCSGNLIVTGGSITVTAGGDTSGKEGDGSIPDGAAVSVVNRSYPGGTPTATISGGTFKSASGVSAVQAYTWSSNTVSDWTDAGTYINISGGYYSGDVAEAYWADGFKCIELAESVSGCGYQVVAESSDFYGASLLFKDIIQIRYYFQIDGYDAGNVTAAGLVVWEIGDYDADAELTLENCSYCTTDGLTANGNYYYATSEGIPAKNMGDSQYVRYYYTTEDGQTLYSATTVKYSPRIYAENKLAQYGEDSDLGKLAIALLNYGTAAQVYFAYDVENPMNASLTDSQKAWEYDSSVLGGYPVTETLSLSDATSNDNITKYGWSTVLKGALELNLYCKIPSELLENATEKGIIYWNGSDYSVAESLSVLDYTGKTDTLTANGNYYYGSITRIAAKNMGDTYYACVYVIDSDGNTTYSNVYVYSVYNYASNKIASGSETLQDLCKSLVIYGEAAKAYFTSQQS